MDRSEALSLLGISESDASDRAVLRSAYRRRIRTVHPDLNPGADAQAATIRISAAYRMLGQARPDPGPDNDRDDRSDHVETVEVHLIDDSTVRIDTGHEEALTTVIEAAHELGEIGYLDAQVGLVEVVVEFENAPTSSLLMTLEERPDGIDVFCEVEPLSGGDSPPPAAVTALVARTLAGITRRGG